MRALEDQVRVEFEASLQYILMAAHFDQVSRGWVQGGGAGWRGGEGAGERPSLEALDSRRCAGHGQPAQPGQHVLGARRRGEGPCHPVHEGGVTA